MSAPIFHADWIYYAGLNYTVASIALHTKDIVGLPQPSHQRSCAVGVLKEAC